MHGTALPAFADHAGPLAEWTMDRLVHRTDAWGRYLPGGGQLTQRGRLTQALLERHYRGLSSAHILGLHTATADNLCKAGALDIDQHGDDEVRAENNLWAALAWYSWLAHDGFAPLLTSSNGKGGYHLRILLAQAVDAARVYHFLRWLTRDHQRWGLDRPPEQFPKQPDVRKCSRGLGNWIRLPGRHHRRDHWSEVWDGHRWLTGEQAIAYILCQSGDDSALVPEVPSRSARKIAPSSLQRSLRRGRIERRIERYMQRLPNLSEGQGRDDVAFRLAAFLVRDLALADQEALPWLEAWDRSNNPPKGRERLAAIVSNAKTYGQHDVGCGV